MKGDSSFKAVPFKKSNDMKAKLGIFLLVLCVISFFLYNKRGANKDIEREELMRGIVISAVDNKPIQNVEIAVSGSNPSSMTNSDGEFFILVRPSHELVFKHPQYRSLVLVASDAKNVKMEIIDSTFVNKTKQNLIEKDSI